jgi:hypothetical protein
MSFEAFPKIPRLSREVIVTEKIDGTNAQVLITPAYEDHVLLGQMEVPLEPGYVTIHNGMAIYAGSRNRWLQPGKSNDNFGFAAWVVAHDEELLGLGAGRHYGEWWGQGIGRGYELNHKRFSLFNVNRWNDDNVPAGCHVVPTLYRGDFHTPMVEMALRVLDECGSQAALGFDKPEGIIVYHTTSGHLFKKTLRGDEHKEAA